MQDTHTLDFRKVLTDNRVSLTLLRLVDPEVQAVKYFVDSLTEKAVLYQGSLNVTANTVPVSMRQASLKVCAWSRTHTELCDALLQTEMALMNDAVFLFARALRLLHFEDNKTFDVQALDCHGVTKSAYGFQLANLMKSVST